jgi:transposase-like protein
MSESKSTTCDDAVVIAFRQNIAELMRGRIRQAIETVLDEELASALGSDRYERTDARKGYRNGGEERRITTRNGTQVLRVPRGRVEQPDGSTHELRSEVLPRYARRTREIDETILAVYLSGANSRRIRKGLEPLLGAAHLSKSAVSRVVGRLKGLFEEWDARDLSDESYPIVFLDGVCLRVRMARRIVSVPVLVALGVREDGQKVLLSLRLATSESESRWGRLIGELRKRKLAAPMLVVVDGGSGLKKALEGWPEVRVQRCTQHKIRNLKEHCPAHARKELVRDFNKVVYAKDGMAARKAYDDFLTKWKTLCPAVARSLEEAGPELLTFYEFPKALWRSKTPPSYPFWPEPVICAGLS